MSKICGTCGLPVAGDEPSDGRDHLTNDGCLDTLLRAVARLREERDEYRREWESACERERARWEQERRRAEADRVMAERERRDAETMRGMP